MKRRVHITELAESDLAEIWAYIAADNPNAADQFITRLRLQCEKLGRTPELGRLRPELVADIRSFAVSHHVIFYFVTDTSIEIARVLHGARDLPELF